MNFIHKSMFLHSFSLSMLCSDVSFFKYLCICLCIKELDLFLLCLVCFVKHEAFVF